VVADQARALTITGSLDINIAILLDHVFATSTSRLPSRTCVRSRRTRYGAR
jgi:hypothetical protein